MVGEDTLLSKYPNVVQAVCFVELIVCDMEGGESSWNLTVKAGFSPNDVLNTIKHVLDDDVREPCGVPPEIVAKARTQCDLPEFRRYLAGKLGLV